MTNEDKKNVIDALEELKDGSIGLVAATIEDCQKIIRELPERKENKEASSIPNEKIINGLHGCAMDVDLRYSFLLGAAAGRIRNQEEKIRNQKEIICTQNEKIAASETVLAKIRAALEETQ